MGLAQVKDSEVRVIFVPPYFSQLKTHFPKQGITIRQLALKSFFDDWITRESITLKFSSQLSAEIAGARLFFVEVNQQLFIIIRD